jgi:hypothetical protein
MHCHDILSRDQRELLLTRRLLKKFLNSKVFITHVKNHVVGQGRGQNDWIVTTINGICPWSSPTDDTCIPY